MYNNDVENTIKLGLFCNCSARLQFKATEKAAAVGGCLGASGPKG